MTQNTGASADADRAATATQPSPAVSGKAGIPCAFTPGPWVVNPFNAQVDCQKISEAGGLLPVAQMLWPTDERSEDETEANGHLIAAAPELYEALTEIAKGEGPFNRDPLIHAENTIESMKEIAKAALAKARGVTA